MEDLYLPPRSRKTLQKVNQEEGKSGKSKKDESDDSSYDGSDEDQPRKRGRPRVGTKEIVKGFTDAEVYKNILYYIIINMYFPKIISYILFNYIFADSKIY